MKWLTTTEEHPFIIASKAHLQLVTIHPFIDGNGRTARLLMNLILLHFGYPPALIMPEDRPEYIAAVAAYQLNNTVEAFYAVMAKAVERSFAVYLQ